MIYWILFFQKLHQHTTGFWYSASIRKLGFLRTYILCKYLCYNWKLEHAHSTIACFVPVYHIDHKWAGTALLIIFIDILCILSSAYGLCGLHYYSQPKNNWSYSMGSAKLVESQIYVNFNFRSSPIVTNSRKRARSSKIPTKRNNESSLQLRSAVLEFWCMGDKFNVAKTNLLDDCVSAGEASSISTISILFVQCDE